MIIGAFSLVVVISYTVIGFKLSYAAGALMLIVDLFFLKLSQILKIKVSELEYSLIFSKIISSVIGIFFRIFLLSFFIFSFEILSNLETCNYDLVLRCLFTFIPIYLYYSSFII